MKILVFSDSHLDLPFDEKKCNFLKNLIQKADRVVINGDFWEGFMISFDQFVNSPWKSLFPLLKSKKTVYIYGNHDEATLSDERIQLFSDIQSTKYSLKLDGKTLTFEHGDSYAPIEFTLIDRISESFSRQVNYWLDQLEKGLIRSGAHKLFMTVAGKPLNTKIKKIVKDRLADNELLICGHTHCKEIDTHNKFINTGFIKHGLAQYMLIENNKFNFREEWYL